MQPQHGRQQDDNILNLPATCVCPSEQGQGVFEYGQNLTTLGPLS
jgi:hypothetical protein